MKNTKVTLSFGEVELTPEDLKALKPIVDEAFASLDDTIYKKLKVSTPDEIREALAAMSDEDLLQIAKQNDARRQDGRRPDAFSAKIFQELFKRAGYGYKQLSHMSLKQRNYLASLGLRF